MEEGASMEYVVREVCCYNRTEGQNLLLQVMLCMQWDESNCPFFHLVWQNLLFCLSFSDAEWTGCSFCALWWHSVEITGATVLYQLNIRLSVINSASLEDPWSSVSKQEIAITPGKVFPQAEIHESVGVILCCEFLWRNETFWFPALKKLLWAFQFQNKQGGTLHNIPTASGVLLVQCCCLFGWEPCSSSFAYEAVVSCCDPLFIIFNYNSLAEQRQDAVLEQCGLPWSGLRCISKNCREPAKGGWSQHCWEWYRGEVNLALE